MRKYRDAEGKVFEALELQWETWDDACDFVTLEGFRGCYIGEDGFPIDDYSGYTEKIGALLPIGQDITLVARQGDYIIRHENGDYDVLDPVFLAECEPI